MTKAIETFAPTEAGEKKLEVAANEKEKGNPPFVLRNVERDSRISCLRWAVLGVFENSKALQIEGYFDQCPTAYWRGLIQGAIAGSEGGSVAEDMRFYKALLANRLHFSDAEPANQTTGAAAKGKNTALKDQYDLLLRSAFDAWTERDPRAVLAWLQTDDGKAWNYTLPRVLAVCGLGSVEALAQVAQDPRYAITADNLADACYQSGWDAAAIRQYVDSLPPGQGNLFLAAYGKQLAKGSPRAVFDFVDSAEPSLLIPEMAKALALGILRTGPHLLGKLTAQLTPGERDELIDASCKKLEPGCWTTNFATAYLQIRGIAGAYVGSAVCTLARADFSNALSIVRAAPSEKQNELLENAYYVRVEQLADHGEPMGAVFNEIKSLPPEVGAEVTGVYLLTLSSKDSTKCLEALDKYFPNDSNT